MNVYDLTLIKSQQKGRVKPDFVLLPQDNRAPVIKSQPIRNFIQYVHLDKNGQPAAISPSTSTVQLLKGTTFSFGVIVEDPANALDPFDTSRLTFIWKLNGSEIYALSALNDGRGTPSVYLEKEFVDESINGEYTVEVTNDYGTTISTPFSIEVIDKLSYPYFYKNLIKNDSGNKGLEDWTVSDNVVVQQFLPRIVEAENFASIYNLQATTRNQDGSLVEYEPEIPFAFSSANNWNSFTTFWNAIRKNDTAFIADRQWWLSQLPGNIIPNEYPNLPYGSFFPSPYWVDRTNNNILVDVDGNVTIRKQGTLVESLNLTETYFTRDKIKFNRYGGKPQATMTQTIDVSEIVDVIDGRVPGLDKVLAQFFAYVGIGISKYEYLFSFRNGETRRISSTYFLDSKNIERLFNGEAVQPLNIDLGLVSRIDIIPICYDTATITINYQNDNGIIGTTVIKGPDEYDAFAIKEKFLLSEQFTTLFSTALDFSKIRETIPVFIFNQKYFELSNQKLLVEERIKNREREELSIGQRILNIDISLNQLRRDYRAGSVTQKDYNDRLASLTAQRVGAASDLKVVQNVLKSERSRLVELNNILPDKNRNWLKANNYPQSDKAKKIKALVDPFDRGVAGMIGVGKQITIPSKTKTISISIIYTNTSQGSLDENPTIPSSTDFVWDREDVYGEHVSDLRRYEYNNPKTGITQIKFMLFPDKVAVHPTTQPTYIIPNSQTIFNAKSDLFRNTHDSTNTIVYKEYTKITNPEIGKFVGNQNANSGSLNASKNLTNASAALAKATSTGSML